MPRSSFQKYRSGELRRFLASVDKCLHRQARLVVIGGGAAALGYDVDTVTRDVDAFEGDWPEIEEAARCAREATGLDIPVERAAVADVPLNYEARLHRVMPKLRRLRVLVLEKHDLALSKIVRGAEHDIGQIVALHEKHTLDQETLVARYLDEMQHAVTNLRSMDLNLINCVERLFGEMAAVRTKKRIDSYRQSHSR